MIMARHARVTEAEAAHYEMLAAERDAREAYDVMKADPTHNYPLEYAYTSAANYAGTAAIAYAQAMEVQFKYPEPNDLQTDLYPDWAIVAEWQYDIAGREIFAMPPTLKNDFGVNSFIDFYKGCVAVAPTPETGQNLARVDTHFAKNGTVHYWHYDSHGLLWHRAEIRIARP